MRTHFFTALMALVLSACASHHRDVASVQNEDPTENSTSGESQQAALDGVSFKGDRGIR